MQRATVEFPDPLSPTMAKCLAMPEFECDIICGRDGALSPAKSQYAAPAAKDFCEPFNLKHRLGRLIARRARRQARHCRNQGPAYRDAADC